MTHQFHDKRSYGEAETKSFKDRGNLNKNLGRNSTEQQRCKTTGSQRKLEEQLPEEFLVPRAASWTPEAVLQLADKRLFLSNSNGFLLLAAK